MTQLTEKQCVPCRGKVEPLKGEALKPLAKELQPGWKVIDEHHLEREYRFDNFRDALELVNEIGELAELENHHPDLQLSYGKVVVQLWTHKIHGLHENDFILAAKIDALRAGDGTHQ
jgi:4a-hydroxytetrahydrobiopterin dehydratase